MQPFAVFHTALGVLYQNNFKVPLCSAVKTFKHYWIFNIQELSHQFFRPTKRKPSMSYHHHLASMILSVSNASLCLKFSLSRVYGKFSTIVSETCEIRALKSSTLLCHSPTSVYQINNHTPIHEVVFSLAMNCVS